MPEAPATAPGVPAAPQGNRPAASPGAASARELQVPATWQAIDFISDLHLCSALPRTTAAFKQHLHSTPADAVFILGDLFELWVGDDMAQQDFEAGCIAAMREASRRLTLAFMVGNRDFLAGPQLMLQAGLMPLHDPTVLQGFGQRVLLSHGDALCLADEPYQAFRREVRSEAWKFRFLAQSLPERLKIAADIRSASRQRQLFDGASHADLDGAATLRWMQAAQAPVLVHGHTHKPASHTVAPGYTRHVLTDWDLDHGERAEVLRLSAQGFVRLPVVAG